MKTLLKTRSELQEAGRWDIDFHLPPEGIKKFPPKLLRRVDRVARITRDKRDPTKRPDTVFLYVDISSVDVVAGIVINPQEVEGADAPSRARKVIRAFDILISTCRPTRGAIAVVPPHLHNQIASTGFSIIRPNADTNPFYLQYALRLPSTLEQFRKWSTGSSYPAILDEDVAKTLVPVPEPEEQDRIAKRLMEAFHQRSEAIARADCEWQNTANEIYGQLSGSPEPTTTDRGPIAAIPHTIAEIRKALDALPELTLDGDRDQTAMLILKELELV